MKVIFILPFFLILIFVTFSHVCACGYMHMSAGAHEGQRHGIPQSRLPTVMSFIYSVGPET